jgi:hypothetical protein
MTVATGAAKAGPYTGNDVTSAFAFSFKVFADADIRVVKTIIATEVESDLVLNTNYTVTRNNDQDSNPGGTVTYKVGGVTTALPSTAKLTIVGDFDYEQPTDIPNGGSFFAQTIENAFDRVTLLVKQLKEKLDRAVVVDVSSSTDPATVIDDLLTAEAAAIAAASAAATSETNAANSASAASTSATNAANSASAASTSATNASNSASAAATSETNAASSASAASTSASAASTSATNASNSASAASTSATNASNSASAASTSATNASNSASAASTSATNAATSETNAAASATAAAATLASALWRDVVFVTSADSPVTVNQASNGKLYVADTSSGAISFTLPQISGLTLPYSVGIKFEAGSNAVTINRSGTDTIDGATSKTLTSNGGGTQLLADTDPAPDKWTAVDFGTAGGNLVDETFTGGVDFTAGSTTSLTLANSYGNEQNIHVHFDAAYQGPEEYTLSGTTLTFTSAIPIGVSKVYVKGGTTLSVGTPADATVTDAKLASGCVKGTHTIYVPAGAMTARTTNGAAAGSVESTTNKIMVKTLDFDASTEEYAQFQVRMPKSWDEGTITAAFTWTANSTSTNSVVWGLQAVALTNDETIDTAFGTGQTVTDANTATAYQAHLTGATSAITIGSSPAAQDLVVFQVYRKAADAADTLAVDALLMGVTLYYTTDATTDA